MGNIMRLLGTRPGTRLVANLIGIDTYNNNLILYMLYLLTHATHTYQLFNLLYVNAKKA